MKSTEALFQRMVHMVYIADRHSLNITILNRAYTHCFNTVTLISHHFIW